MPYYPCRLGKNPLHIVHFVQRFAYMDVTPPWQPPKRLESRRVCPATCTKLCDCTCCDYGSIGTPVMSSITPVSCEFRRSSRKHCSKIMMQRQYLPCQDSKALYPMDATLYEEDYSLISPYQIPLRQSKCVLRLTSRVHGDDHSQGTRSHSSSACVLESGMNVTLFVPPRR